MFEGVGHCSRNSSPEISGDSYNVATLHRTDVPRLVCEDPKMRAAISEVTTVGLDLAKKIFRFHGADDIGRSRLGHALRLKQDQPMGHETLLQYEDKRIQNLSEQGPQSSFVCMRVH